MGVTLAVLALAPSIQLANSFEATGVAAANTTSSVAVNATGFAYSEVFLRGAVACDLAVFVLNPSEALAFLQAQSLPPEYLGCRQTHGVFEDDIALLVFDNPSDSPIPYEVLVESVSVTQPYGVWILPASASLALGGAISIRRILRRGLTGIVDELLERDAHRPPIDRGPPRR